MIVTPCQSSPRTPTTHQHPALPPRNSRGIPHEVGGFLSEGTEGSDASVASEGRWLGGVGVRCVPSGKRLHSELENHHFHWENSSFLWSFFIAMLNYQWVVWQQNMGRLRM